MISNNTNTFFNNDEFFKNPNLFLKSTDQKYKLYFHFSKDLKDLKDTDDVLRNIFSFVESEFLLVSESDLKCKRFSDLTFEAHPGLFIQSLLGIPETLLKNKTSSKGITADYLKKLNTQRELSRLLNEFERMPHLSFMKNKAFITHTDTRYIQIFEVLATYFYWDPTAIRSTLNQLIWDLKDEEQKIAKSNLFSIVDKVQLIKQAIIENDKSVLEELAQELKFLGGFMKEEKAMIEGKYELCMHLDDYFYQLIASWKENQISEIHKPLVLSLLKLNNGVFAKDLPIQNLLEKAIKSFPKDKEVVLTVVDRNGKLVQYADETLKDDIEVMLTAGKDKANSLQYAPRKLLYDKEFLFNAFEKIGVSTVLSQLNIKDLDREILIEIIRRKEVAAYDLFWSYHGDKEIVTEVIKHHPSLYSRASDELKEDHDIISLTLSVDGKMLEYMSEKIRGTAEYVMLAIKTDPKQYCNASDLIKKHQDIISLTLSLDITILQYMPDDTRNIAEYVVKAIKTDPSLYSCASEELKNNHDIISLTLSLDGTILENMSEEIRNKAEYVIMAINQNANAYESASTGLKKDIDIAKMAFKKNGLQLQFAPLYIRNNKELVMIAVEENGDALQFATEGLKDDNQVVSKAYKSNPESTKYMSPRLQKMNFLQETVDKS